MISKYDEQFHKIKLRWTIKGVRPIGCSPVPLWQRLSNRHKAIEQT